MIYLKHHLQRMLRVVVFAKTSKETRKVRFKVCTDLIENNSHILLKHVTVNSLVCGLLCQKGQPF